MDRTATATPIIANLVDLLRDQGRAVRVPFNNRLEVEGQHLVAVEDHDGVAFLTVTTADRARLIAATAQFSHMPAGVIIATVDAYLGA